MRTLPTILDPEVQGVLRFLPFGQRKGGQPPPGSSWSCSRTAGSPHGPAPCPPHPLGVGAAGPPGERSPDENEDQPGPRNEVEVHQRHEALDAVRHSNHSREDDIGQENGSAPDHASTSIAPPSPPAPGRGVDRPGADSFASGSSRRSAVGRVLLGRPEAARADEQVVAVDRCALVHAVVACADHSVEPSRAPGA